MRLVTPTLSICALAAAFTAGALTAGPRRPAVTSTSVTVTSAVPAPATADEAVITISSFAFSNVTVAPGATVRVVNEDSDPHTITSTDGSFDVAADSRAYATLIAPSTAGAYAYVCSVHPSMTGTLTVA